LPGGHRAARSDGRAVQPRCAAVLHAAAERRLLFRACFAKCNMSHTPCNMQRVVGPSRRVGRSRRSCFCRLSLFALPHVRRAYPQANETEVDALYARVAELERFSAACTCQDTRGNLACDRRHTWHATGSTPGMRQAAHLACDRRHTWHATGGTPGVQRAVLRFPTARTARDTRCATVTAPRETARAHACARAWRPPREVSVGSRPCAAAELFAMRAC
jgi:hypothetical protein